MGLINGVGNLGSFFGPYIGGWLSDLSGGGYALTQAFFGGVFGIAALLVLTLRKQLRAATALEPAGTEKVPKEEEPASNPV
jgi:MFS family permease